MEKKRPGKRVISEEKGKEKTCVKTEGGDGSICVMNSSCIAVFGRNKFFSSQHMTDRRITNEP